MVLDVDSEIYFIFQLYLVDVQREKLGGAC